MTVNLEKEPGLWRASFWLDEPRPSKHVVRGVTQAEALRRVAEVLDILNASEQIPKIKEMRPA